MAHEVGEFGTSEELTHTIKVLSMGCIGDRIQRLQEWLENPERTRMEMAGALSSAMALINAMKDEGVATSAAIERLEEALDELNESI